MNFAGLRRTLPFLSKSSLAIALHGRHGIGKTQGITKYYEDQGHFVVNFRLNTKHDVGDIIGLQDPLRDENGNAIASRHLMAEELFAAVEFCKKNPGKRALILMDEMNRPGTMELIGPIFQFTLDRKIGAHDFSKYNIDVIALMNFVSDDYDTKDIFRDKALRSRFIHLEFAPSQDEWLNDYMRVKHTNSKTVRFLSANPQFIEIPSAPFSVDELAEPDRRRWDDIAPFLDNDVMHTEDKLEVIAGYMGLVAAQSYLNWEENEDKVIYLEDILNYNKDLQEKMDEVFKNNRIDVLHSAVDTLAQHLKALKDKKEYVSVDQAVTIVEFIKGLPDSLELGALLSLYRDYLNPVLRIERKEYVEALNSRVTELMGDETLAEVREIVDKTVKEIKEEADNNTDPVLETGSGK